MPFEKFFDDLYELGIKAACGDADAHCERVDEQIFEESILQRVYNQIAKADLIIAEMTGRNPNVFYEVGYAHALGKRVILLTAKADDIPFDLKHYPHIVHDNRITDLKSELFKRVKWFVENPKEAKRFFNPTLECFVNGTRIVANPLVESTQEQPHWSGFDVSIKNSEERTIQIQDFQFGIVAPAGWYLHRLSPRLFGDEYISTQAFSVPPDHKLHLAESAYQLLPGAWVKIFARFGANDKNVPSDTEYNLAIRLFTPSGPLDFPFRKKHGQ